MRPLVCRSFPSSSSSPVGLRDAWAQMEEEITIADSILVRKRTIGATASTAAGLTAWSGATGTQGQRERDAEEIAKVYDERLVFVPYRDLLHGEVDTIKGGLKITISIHLNLCIVKVCIFP